MAISFEIHNEVGNVLDVGAVEAALAALTLRHEALRTLFKLGGGVLSQVIVSHPLYRLSTEDLALLPPAEREAALEAEISRHSRTVIDLEHGPVLHALLIHLDGPEGQRHVLAFTLHHIVCDGWSNGILVRDFTLLYENLHAGRPAMQGLPQLPFQFADFAFWQAEYLASPAAAEAAAFWHSQLTEELCALDMPTDHARPAGRSFPGHIESALLPPSTDQLLTAYCRTTGSTKHIVLLAAFQAFCSAYTGQEHFLLGSTIANRTQPGMEDVVGRFANPQIIVAHVDHDPSFTELEQRVRAWETAAYQHQDLPFSRVIEDLQLDQASASSQFLQVWFLYQRAFMQPQAGGSIRVTPRRSVSGGVDFDLLVSVVERAEGPRIQCEYNTLLFSPERIRTFIDGFVELLDAALQEPSQKLSSLLPLLAPASTTRLATVTTSRVEQQEQSPSSEPQETFFSRILLHRSRRPEALACTDAHATLTWRELDDRSEALAAALPITFPDTSHIAVVLAPQVESVVALLAALRLGLAIIPLPAQTDPDGAADCLLPFPRSVLLAPYRSHSIAGLAFADFPKASAAVPTSRRANKNSSFVFPEEAERSTVVSADRLFAEVAEVLPSLQLQPGGDDCHSASNSLLCFSPGTAAAACFDVLLALISGAQLNFAAFPSSLQNADVPGRTLEQIGALCIAHEPSGILATPAQARALASSGWSGDRRIQLIVRGERLPSSLASLLTLRLKSAVYLLLAPESGKPVALQVLTGDQAAHGLKPIGDSTLILTSTDGHILPNGARGELRLRNSLGDLQQTGLLVQSTATGVIERADRSERFVQLRGHKISLGEIEDAAFALPSVREAAAIINGSGAEAALTIYLVASSASSGRQDASLARQHFTRTLPPYLVPSEVIWVDRLPFGPSGRLDLARLARNHQDHHSPATGATPASLTMPGTNDDSANEVLQKLASIWQDVLSLKSIDPHKSFFDLGGSSLLLVRLFARVNKTFATALPITTIFDAPTVSSLAILLGGNPQISHLVRVRPTGSRPPLFLVHSYLLYQGLSKSLGPDQPFFGLRELEEDGHLKIEERVQKYVEEIRKIQPQGPYRLAGWCAAGPLTVELARQLIQSGQKVAYLALFDAWLPGYVESIETARKNESWLSQKGGSGKLGYHRSRMQGLGWSKKLAYSWTVSARMVREFRYRIYLNNWQRLHRLAQKYNFSLPQFLHNTSFETFSALKEFQSQRVPIRITLIRAREAREVPGATASCGWEQIAEQGVDVIWAPGDHETMFLGENLKVTSDIVRRGLEATASLNHGNGSAPEAAVAATNQILGVLHVDCPGT
jgi:non-ribosomal peptide synthetase component F/thioesterase domain-containing protein/acyl carrier protein